MKRYEVIIKEQESMTNTFEFYLDIKGHLMVEHNLQTYSFIDAFNKKKAPNSQFFVTAIYSAIIRKYKSLEVVQQSMNAKDPKEKLILKLILMHLSIKDRKLDIIIHSNGKVDFNLENISDTERAKIRMQYRGLYM